MLLTPAALILFALCPQDASPKTSDPVLEKLLSSDRTVMFQGVKEARRQTSWSRPVLHRLLALINVSDKDIRKAVQAELSRRAIHLKPELRRIIDTGRPTHVVASAVRTAAETKDPQYEELFFGLLDGDPKTSAEATRALYFIATAKTDERILGIAARMNRELAEAETATKQDLIARQRGNVLYYLHRRNHPKTFPLLVESFESPVPTMWRLADDLLTRTAADRFYAIARKKLGQVPAELEPRYLDFIARRKISGDRSLGFASYSKLESKDPALHAALKQLLPATSAWLGSTSMPDGIEGFSYTLKLTGRVETAKKNLIVTSTRSTPDPSAQLGIDFPLPFAEVLLRPVSVAAKVRKGDRRTIVDYTFGPTPATFMFGNGSRDAGIWYGREVLRAARATTRLNERLHPVDTTLFDADGKTIARLRYGKMIERGERFTPSDITVQTPKLRLRVQCQWREDGLWLLESSELEWRNPADPTALFDRLSEGLVSDLTVMPLAKPSSNELPQRK